MLYLKMEGFENPWSLQILNFLQFKKVNAVIKKKKKDNVKIIIFIVFLKILSLFHIQMWLFLIQSTLLKRGLSYQVKKIQENSKEF